MTTYRCPHCGIEFNSSRSLMFPTLSVWLVGLTCRFWFRGPKDYWRNREGGR
jgi:hypothetical protein